MLQFSKVYFYCLVQDTSADKCIDNITESVRSSLCVTNSENAPWLALEFSELVIVKRVVIYNRGDHGVPGEPHYVQPQIHNYHNRLKNVEVRVTKELPTSGEKMFTEGELLGTFAGPGGLGQIISVEGPTRTGRFVLVQMNNTEYLNLHEVEVFGSSGAQVKSVLL